MKRYFLILILLIIPISVKASECDYQDMARYQKLASNINFSYDFVESNNTVSFNITVSNMHNDLYIVDETTGNVFSSATVGSSETVLYNYQPGNDYKFSIIPYDIYCFEEVVMSRYVNLPAYNPYYNDPVCQGNEQYKLCQKWFKMDYSYENFVKNVNNYKENLNNEENIEETENMHTDDFLNKIIVGFLDNYVIILVTIIAICTIGISIISKKDKFDLK